MNIYIKSRVCDRVAPPGISERGVTLVEVMITMLIIAIGLMGLAAMEISALRRTNDSVLRSLASLQAHDMVGRMRVNIVGMEDGYYNDISGTGTNPPDCAALTAPAYCTPEQIAQIDRFEWNTFNASLFPSGVGTVTGPDSDSVYTITINWSEIETGGGTTKSFSYEVRPL